METRHVHDDTEPLDDAEKDVAQRGNSIIATNRQGPLPEPIVPAPNVLEEMSSLAERLIERFPDGSGGDRPADGAMNYRHYLYGQAKTES